MQFVNNRFRHIPSEMAVILPIKIVVDDHHTLGRTNDSVGAVLECPRQRLGVWIDQSRRRVEPLSVRRVIRTVGLEVVQLAGPQSWQEQAPDVAPTVDLRIKFDNLGRFGIFNIVVQ